MKNLRKKTFKDILAQEIIRYTFEALGEKIREVNMSEGTAEEKIHHIVTIYFSKKYKRVGHLWQGRFKSWFVTNDAYLYSLMQYIEQNPLKANIVKSLEEYPYSSYHYFLENQIPECLQQSWIVQHYQDDREAIKEFLNSSVDTSQLQEMKKASSLVEAPNVDSKPDIEKLRKMLEKEKDKKERNKQIVKAYQQGYSQHMIAKVLELNQATVQRVIKRTKV